MQCTGLSYTDFKNSNENLITLTTPNLYITSFIAVWERSSKWIYISLQQWLKLRGNNILKGLLLNIYTSHAGKIPCMPYTGQVDDPTFFSLTGTGTDFSVYLIRFMLARGSRFSYGCGTLQPFTYFIFWAKQNKNEKIIQAQQVSIYNALKMYSNLYLACEKFPVLLETTSTCYEFNALKMRNARRL